MCQSLAPRIKAMFHHLVSCLGNFLGKTHILGGIRRSYPQAETAATWPTMSIQARTKPGISPMRLNNATIGWPPFKPTTDHDVTT